MRRSRPRRYGQAVSVRLSPDVLTRLDALALSTARTSGQLLGRLGSWRKRVAHPMSGWPVEWA